jgi:hypothetical protein
VRTRLKKSATFDSRSLARADTRAVKSVITPKAAALRPVARSTDRIPADALAVLPAAVWMLSAMARGVSL